MKRERQHIISGVLIAILVLHWANINFYNHTHIVEGETLVHSHPYASSSHSHSGASFSTIGWLSGSFNLIELTEQFSLRLFEELFFEVLGGRATEKYYFGWRTETVLRGPPVLFRI